MNENNEVNSTVMTLGKSHASSLQEVEELRDIYCWHCHQLLINENEALSCTKCVRVLHPKCNVEEKGEVMPTEEGSVYECPACRVNVTMLPQGSCKGYFRRAKSTAMCV